MAVAPASSTTSSAANSVSTSFAPTSGKGKTKSTAEPDTTNQSVSNAFGATSTAVGMINPIAGAVVAAIGAIFGAVSSS